eukprot:gene14491-16044_t
MLKKTSNIENLNKEDEKKEKRQKIQWDEVTIAEHDKERGSRQKIDEAPTPYRYLSESDQSEAEYSSDGEHLARCKAGNTVADSWETLHAKLQYEKHLQDNALTNSRLEQLETSYDYSSSHDTGTGDEMSVGTSDPSTTEFGEILSEKKLSTEKKLPIRPAIKNTGSSNNSASGPVTSPKPTKPRTNSSEKPRKSVLIKANDSTTSNNNHQHHHHHHSTSNNNATTAASFSNSSNYWGSSNAFSSSASPSTLPGSNNNVGSSSTMNNTTSSSVGNNNHQLFAGINNGSIDGDEEEGNEEGEGETTQNRELFKRKRAGHYNEFKVLQAMRAKLHDDEDDDDDDDREVMNNKPSYPALVRQRSLEKVTNVQPTPIIQAVIPTHSTTSQILPPPPASGVTSLPPAPPKSTNTTEVADAVPMEEN